MWETDQAQVTLKGDMFSLLAQRNVVGSPGNKRPSSQDREAELKGPWWEVANPMLFWTPATNLRPTYLPLPAWKFPDWWTPGRITLAGVGSSCPVEGRWVFICPLTRNLSITYEKVWRTQRPNSLLYTFCQGTLERMKGDNHSDQGS